MDELFEQMEQVRKSGITNMFARHSVVVVARQLDLDELADHLEPMTMRDYIAFLDGFAERLG